MQYKLISAELQQKYDEILARKTSCKNNKEKMRHTMTGSANSCYRWTINRYDEEFIEALATESCYTANAIGYNNTFRHPTYF